MEGIHDRTDYDLTQHMKYSGTGTHYTDPQTGEKYIPWILETSMGLGRYFLHLYRMPTPRTSWGERIECVKTRKRTCTDQGGGISSPQKQTGARRQGARSIHDAQERNHAMECDDNGNIGKRYRRQDEVGTPWCITIDFDTLGMKVAILKDTVTLRHRDTGEQERVAIAELPNCLPISSKKFDFVSAASCQGEQNQTF